MLAAAVGAAALTASLVAATGSPASAAVAAAPTGVDRVVSVSGAIDSSCGAGIAPGTPVYTSIQAAVNAAATGEQIYVCAGTYTESVSVTTSNIDLLGPNWSDPTGSSDPATIVAADSGSPVVDFGTTSGYSNGVRGFTLEGGTYGVRSEATLGCCWIDASTEGIRNNIITGSTVAGIETNGIDTGVISGNQITPAADADGIRTYDAAGALDIQSNTIDLSGSGVGITIGGSGEQCCQTVGGSTPALGNTITGGATGILVIDALADGILIDANTIQNNVLSDMSGAGVLLDGAIRNTSVYDNTITNVGGDGVRAQNADTNDADDIRVRGNTITNPGGAGVAFDGHITSSYVGGVLPTDGNTIVGAGGDGIAITGLVEVPGDQFLRVLSMNVIYVFGNTVEDPAGAGISLVNVEVANVNDNTVTGAGADGIVATDIDAFYAYRNDVQASAGDALHLDNVAIGTLSSNDLVGNAGDGIELTNNTSAMTVTLNTVNDNAAGVRVTSPTVRASSYIGENDLGGNTGYACEDQSSGVIINPPAAGTQGNDWTPTNTGAVLQSPVGICGAVPLTITAATLPDGTLGAAYTSPTPTVVGGTGPYTWSATGLPAGLTIDPATGVVSGTPTVAVADQPVTITVTDANGEVTTFETTITVLPDDPGVPMSDPLTAGVGLAAAIALLALQRRRRAVA
ncbi:MAG: right-handed parallel beta-helix repeat-containing protein [Acidimicrobiales bacterium]